LAFPDSRRLFKKSQKLLRKPFLKKFLICINLDFEHLLEFSVFFSWRFANSVTQASHWHHTGITLASHWHHTSKKFALHKM